MADQGKQWIPNPPGGLHGPSIEGSGHILDPAVRRELRELLVPALMDAFRHLAGATAEMAAGSGRPPVEDLLPPMPGALPAPPAVPLPNLPEPALPAPPSPPYPLPNMAAPHPAPTGFDPAEHAHGAPPPIPDPNAPNPPQEQRPAGGRPYPHGDLDLSTFVPANVAPPAFPARHGRARTFYFLEGRHQPFKGG